MAKEEAKKDKKSKRPTAVKRDIQSKKRRFNNRVYRSRARTATKAFLETVGKGDEALTAQRLSEAYSILDKCAKKGVFKANKASRCKSRLAARLVKKG